MKRYFSSRMFRATGSLQWGERGTWKVPAADVQHPIAIEAPIRNALFGSQTVIYASAPYVVGVASGQDSGSGTSGNGHYAPYPAGIQAGDLLVVAIAPRATAGLVAPTGWTTLNSGRAFVIAKVADAADALVGGVVVPPATNARNWQYVTAAIRNWAGSIASDVSYVSGGASNDPSSRTISWGTAAETLSLEYFIDTNAGGALTIVAPTTHAKNTALVQGTEATTGAFISIAMGSANTIAASINPSTWTITGSPVTTDLVGVLVRGNVANGLQVRANYRVVQPTTHSNAQTFYTPTVSVASGGITVVPALHTNTQSFFGPTLRLTLKPSLHSDGETFFAPAVRRTLRPAVHTNSSAFFTQTLRLTLKPSLLSDGDTFFAPAVRRVLRPSLFTNSQSFFTHTLRSVLKPSLYSDGETFFTQTIRSTLKPALYTNSQAYFTHSLRVTLKPTLHSDGETFFTHSVTVAGAGVSPALFTNTQSFFTHSLRATVKPTLHTNSQTFFTQSLRRTLRPSLFSDSDTFFTHSLRRTIRPEHNQNLQSFFNPRLSLRLSPTAYVNSSAFFTHAILLAGFVSPSLWVNSQIFYGPTVTSAALGGYPYDDTKKKKKLVFPYVEEAPKTKRQARKARKKLNEAVVEKISTRLPSPPLPQLVLPDNVRSVTAEYLDAWFEGQLKAEIAAERSLLALAEESYRDFLQRESVATSALEELFPEGEKLNEARLKEEEFLIQLAWSTYFDS